MSRIRSITLVTATTALAVAAASLLGSDPAPVPESEETRRVESATFAETFAPVDRIRLAGSPDEPIGAISGLAFDRAGRIAVADRQSHHVFVFRPDGELERVLGGRGEGPGEFEVPLDVAFGPAGRLYVAEAGSPRITGYGPGLTLDTVLHLEDAYYAVKIAARGEGLLAYVNAPDATSRRLRLLRGDGRETRRFHPSHPAYVETPYWTSTTRRLMATSDRWIVAGGNLVYPLARYGSGGSLVDSVGRAPEEWKQAGRPKPGAFSGPDRLRRFEEWRRTFTTIQNVAILEDRYLVVSHQRLDPDVLAYEDAEYFADVYDLRTSVKLWTGIGLPGPVLAGGDALTLLLEGPPRGWLIGRFAVEG